MLNDLPSCVYANHTNNNNCSNPGNNGRPNNNFRQIQNQYLHHSDCLDSSTPNMGLNSSMGGYGSPYKLCRQQTGIRERKRIQRSAPTGYFDLFYFTKLKKKDWKTNPESFNSQEYQLSFWWAKGPRPNFPLREEVEQDWHFAVGYCLHSAFAGSIDHRLWSFDICGEVFEGRNQGRSGSLEYKW